MAEENISRNISVITKEWDRTRNLLTTSWTCIRLTHRGLLKLYGQNRLSKQSVFDQGLRLFSCILDRSAILFQILGKVWYDSKVTDYLKDMRCGSNCGRFHIYPYLSLTFTSPWTSSADYKPVYFSSKHLFWETKKKTKKKQKQKNKKKKKKKKINKNKNKISSLTFPSMLSV